MSNIVLVTVLWFVVFRSHNWRCPHSLILSTNIYVLVFPWPIKKIAKWYIRSWLSDYILFSFNKSYCRHDTSCILVAFRDSSFGLNKCLQTLWTVPKPVHEIDLMTRCIFILYTHVNLLNKRSLNLNTARHTAHTTVSWPNPKHG